MAETCRKRTREDDKEENDPIREEEEQERPNKRSIHDILFLLESEEEEPTDPNISSLVATLQHELSSSSSPSSSSSSSEPSQQVLTEPDTSPLNQQGPTPLLLMDQETPQEVIKYLLEASDDELGIPKSPIDQSPLEREEQAHLSPLEREAFDQLEFEEGLGLGSGLELEREEATLDCDGWWEMDDQAANYYDFLHSQL